MSSQTERIVIRMFDRLLDDFLKHPEVVKYINTLFKDNPEMSEYDLVIDAIDYFFEGEYSVLFQFHEIFKTVTEHIKEQIDIITSSIENLIDSMRTKLEDIIMEALKEVKNGLKDAAERRLRQL